MTPTQRQARLGGIPPKTLIGRIKGTGRGDAQLVSPGALAQLAVAGGGAPAGGPGAPLPIASHTILANPTGSTAIPIATTLIAGTNITITYGATDITIAASGGDGWLLVVNGDVPVGIICTPDGLPIYVPGPP